MRYSLAALTLVTLVLTGCVAGASGKENGASLPSMRWDHRPEAAKWTSSSMDLVARHDKALASRIPADIQSWCPGYKKANLDERRAFWVGLLSATAKHESTWNPKASGGGGRYVGLMQISPTTAKAHGCEAKTTEQLKDGAKNLACAIKIMSKQVGRDGMVAGGGNKGIGRDWGPFRVASKRAEIAQWTQKQAYCKS